MKIGIDFGTTFSQAATMYLGSPLVLLNLNEYGIPSNFYYDKENGILIGQDALDAGQGLSAKNLVSEVKMSLESGKTFTLDGRVFSAKEIIGEILKALINRAVQVAKTKNIDETVEEIVISVPVIFGVQERTLIQQAAIDCMGTTKIKIKAIIDEPVAAAISYFSTKVEDGKHILVYDLGGGTCDIALVRADSKSETYFTVVDKGVIRLGGRDWDKKLIDYIIDVIEDRTKKKIRGNVGYEEKIRRAAVSVKHNLSDPLKQVSNARVEIDGVIYPVPISLSLFEELTLDLFNLTLSCIQEVYVRNYLNCNISEIICVGGSSNMLQVKKGLSARFPKCKINLFQPEHAVVNGVTIFAHENTRKLKDVTSFSYGIEAYNQDNLFVFNIIKKGDQLPAKGIGKFFPRFDNSEAVIFQIFESDIVYDVYSITEPSKREIGSAVLKLPPNSKKTLILLCTIELNNDGLLEIEAIEPSGKKVKSQIDLKKL
jgi:molecular chaperone DnaK